MELTADQLPALLPSLQPFAAELQLRLTAPPPVLHVHSTYAPAITSAVLRAVLSSDASSIAPRAVFLDCVALHSARLIFDTALNGFAAWTPAFDAEVDGAENWDGRIEGLTVAGTDSEDEERPRKRKRVEWDASILPELASNRGALAGHLDDSVAAFIEGLQLMDTIFPEASKTPRFLVFEHADRLLSINTGTSSALSHVVESGVNDGAFLAAMSRLAELVSAPASSFESS